MAATRAARARQDGRTVAEFDRAQISQDAIIAAMAEGHDALPETVEV